MGTGASRIKRKLPNFETITKRGLEQWLSRLRIRHSTAELPYSTKRGRGREGRGGEGRGGEGRGGEGKGWETGEGGREGER